MRIIGDGCEVGWDVRALTARRTNKMADFAVAGAGAKGAVVVQAYEIATVTSCGFGKAGRLSSRPGPSVRLPMCPGAVREGAWARLGGMRVLGVRGPGACDDRRGRLVRGTKSFCDPGARW